MTRVTAPIAKLTRSLTTAAAAPRPSASGARCISTAATRVRRELELNADGRSSLDASDSSRHMTTTAAHRPVPSPHRMNIPLMQTFHSSPRAAARPDAPGVDFAVLPDLGAAAAAAAPGGPGDAALRVPLLPDNYAPDRSRLAPEAEDAPLPAAQISVVAANPAVVVPASALTEVEGMGVDGVELSFAHAAGPAAAPRETDGGMLRDLWKGLVDDVLGGARGGAKPAL